MGEKTERNMRVQDRYDALMRAGKHGHYETMFRVVREEVDAERERCAKIAETWKSPLRPGTPARLYGHEEAAREIAEAIRAADGQERTRDGD